MKTNCEFETVDTLARVVGGFSWPSANDWKNLGKATVNGGVNTLNFFHDHPVELGKFGKFTIGGDRVTKPFTDDPLSHVREVPGNPEPAK